MKYLIPILAILLSSVWTLLLFGPPLAQHNEGNLLELIGVSACIFILSLVACVFSFRHLLPWSFTTSLLCIAPLHYSQKS